MHEIEKKILSVFEAKKEQCSIENHGKQWKLSCRDSVGIQGVCTVYTLHGFNLFLWDCLENDYYFCVTAEGSKENTCMSNTTKSRLNAFLSRYADTKIVQKDYKNYFAGSAEEITMKTKYRLHNGKIEKVK